MEGNDSNLQPFVLLHKIKELTRSIVGDLSSGQLPKLFIDRFRNYCTDASGNCCCNLDIPKGQEILSLKKECHARRFDILLRVLIIVQQLLQENRHASKRDIYYMHPSVFKDQSVVDHAINGISILLQCSRHHLHVVSVGNGLVMGWLRFSEAGRTFDCISTPNTAQPIPVNVEDVKDLITVAQYILVVEKESATFQRSILQKKPLHCHDSECFAPITAFNKRVPILMYVSQGRGYPDVPTRRFLHLLVGKLHLPVYCLVDCDPYGFDILSIYRFGSLQMAHDAKFLRVPEIRWLGAFPSDADKYCLPQQCLLPLTTEDKTRMEALLLRCYLQREAPDWRFELELLLERGYKFELEALSVHSISFLSEKYLPSKIRDEQYI